MQLLMRRGKSDRSGSSPAGGTSTAAAPQRPAPCLLTSDRRPAGLLTMSAARSGYIYYEPLGWSEERVQMLFMNQLHKKLAMVGVSLPADLEGMLSMVKPTLAGG